MPRTSIFSRFQASVASLVIFSGAVTLCLHADDWPQWRGPDLNLVSQESGLATEWPAAGPEIRWKQKIGIGYSSIAVVGDRLWTMGHADGKGHVYCLSVETGETVWQHSYAGDPVAKLHKGGPGSTPTVKGDRVYAMGKQGQVFCLAKSDGEVFWQFDARKALGVKVPEWGFTGSPVVVGDRVVLDLGHIVALDVNTGELIWKTDRFKPGYGSATPFDFEGQSAIAVLNNEGLSVLATKDGSEIAFHKWITDYVTNSTSPVVINGAGNTRIFLSTGYGRGCTLLEVKEGALETVYENRNLSNHMNNSVIHEGHLFGFDGNSHRGRTVRLVCLDLETGETKWKQLGLGCGSLMKVNDKLLALSEQGDLVLGQATSEAWQEIARAKVIPARCWTVPVLASGKVYCRNDAGDLVCVDLRPTQ